MMETATDWASSDGSVRLLQGDCLERMAEIPEASIDAVVTDPPYGLEFMGKEWDKLWDGRTKADQLATGRPKRGGYTKLPDSAPGKYVAGRTGQAFHEAWATAALRVLKPGGHLVAFGGTRTHHRLMCALEDAGFEIRDTLMWLYGQGFPKSLNVSKQIDRCMCSALPYNHEEQAQPQAKRDVRPMRDGDVSQAIDPGDECGEVLFAGLSEHGTPTAGWPQSATPIRPEQPSLEGRGDLLQDTRELQGRSLSSGTDLGETDGAGRRLHHGASVGDGSDVRSAPDANRGSESPRPQPGEQSPGQPRALADERRPQEGGVWPLCERCGKPTIPDGLGTALKPAWEPIVLARKPLVGTVAANVQAHGTGALNVDGCRVGTGDTLGRAKGGWLQGGYVGGKSPQWDSRGTTVEGGRWPANVVLDEEAAALLDAQSGEAGGGGPASGPTLTGPSRSVARGHFAGVDETPYYGDSGGASRFFYCAKASRAERGKGNTHPTVKPLALMRWLVRLVTPPGGLVLDPFIGSGTTALAAAAEGFRCVGIDSDGAYLRMMATRATQIAMAGI